MLVAEKQHSYYPQYERKEQDPTRKSQLPKRQNRGKTRVQPLPKAKGKVMPIVMLIVIFIFSCLTVGRYAIINQNHQHILELEKALQEEQNIQQNLRIELASCSDLNRIEEVAKEELGMDYPTKGQVQVISLPSDISGRTEENGDIQIAKKTIIERIKEFID